MPELEKHLVDQLSKEEQDSLNSKFEEATAVDKKALSGFSLILICYCGEFIWLAWVSFSVLPEGVFSPSSYGTYLKEL